MRAERSKVGFAVWTFRKRVLQVKSATRPFELTASWGGPLGPAPHPPPAFLPGPWPWSTRPCTLNLGSRPLRQLRQLTDLDYLSMRLRPVTGGDADVVEIPPSRHINHLDRDVLVRDVLGLVAPDHCPPKP